MCQFMKKNSLNSYLSLNKRRLESVAMFVLLLSFVVLANKSEAQSLYVTTGGTVIAQNTAVNIAGNATISSGVTPLVGATVSVSSNFVTGQDVLGLNGAASGGITSSYNSTTGVLTLSGSASVADYQSTIQKATYTNTSATPNTSTRVIAFSLNAALPFTGNGHYFEFISSTDISWTAAYTAANSKTYFGLQGYLATITSSAENTFVYSKINAFGWLGGSDATSEGVWKWVCGPENGTQFWQGTYSGGNAVGEMYNNWAVNQPDNWSPGEHYLNFWSGDHWNDYPNVATGSIAGYVVEYGGMAGDPVIHISDFVTVDFAPKVSNLTTTTGSDIKWYDAPTGGNLLPSTTLLVGGNHYYASQTVNGIESTSRLDVVAVLNLAAPAAATHTASPVQIIWSWTAVPGATGYKWGTTNDYASATDIPSGTSRTETGLTCGAVSYSCYVWAYNASTACVSRPVLLTQTTSACVSAPWTFTNAGATGNTGPTQVQVNSAYTGSTLQGFVTINTQGIQEWTVPATGNYTIDARGAKGGGDGVPGNGAKMVGTFSLTAGQVLKIVVGQLGIKENDYIVTYHAGGGGGGSFVYNNTSSTLLVAAGGGGGNGSDNGGYGGISTYTDSNTGSAGNGGSIAPEGNSGAGYSGNGILGGHNGTTIAYSFLNGAVGGVGASGGGTGYGGFGGGGGEGYADGGGGGGYSGGNTQSNGLGGFGGGSYNAGTNQTNTAGSNSGHGQVIITQL